MAEPTPPSAAGPAAAAPTAPSASSEQDRVLVVEALGGDRRAQERLVTKYREPLVRHVGKMVRSSDDVDDLVQEALIKAFGSLGSYSPDYAFSTWLYKIATNHTIDFLRRRKLPTFSIDQPLPTREGEMGYEIPDSTFRPDRPVEAEQQRALLQEAIAQLPEKYHRVIVMRHEQEMSYEDIADALALPLGTVKAHIFRARALLYRHLKGRRDDLGDE